MAAKISSCRFYTESFHISSPTWCKFLITRPFSPFIDLLSTSAEPMASALPWRSSTTTTHSPVWMFSAAETTPGAMISAPPATCGTAPMSTTTRFIGILSSEKRVGNKPSGDLNATGLPFTNRTSRPSWSSTISTMPFNSLSAAAPIFWTSSSRICLSRAFRGEDLLIDITLKRARYT